MSTFMTRNDKKTIHVHFSFVSETEKTNSQSNWFANWFSLPKWTSFAFEAKIMKPMINGCEKQNQ